MTKAEHAVRLQLAKRMLAKALVTLQAARAGYDCGKVNAATYFAAIDAHDTATTLVEHVENELINATI